jgi:hypothetical protein
LQTKGKTYLATASNISRYTDGRFSPSGLATVANALTEEPHPIIGNCPGVLGSGANRKYIDARHHA